MRVAYRFISEGAVPERVAPNAFYVDVGSIDHPRVFDHHSGQGGDRPQCPADLLWAARDRIREHAEKIDSAVVVTHRQPDWNACWGAWLLTRILKDDDLDEERVRALNAYAGFILGGFDPSEGPVERSALAVFHIFTADIDEAERDPDIRDQRMLDAAQSFFDHLYESIEAYADLKSGSCLSEDGPYGRVILAAREDYHLYLRDLQDARRFTAALKRKTGDIQRVDGLRLGTPRSRLFKFWARSDLTHSVFKTGFVLMWVQWAEDRWIISVSPGSGFVLEGLGDFLTREECRRNPPQPDAPRRPGYDCPNPWYDARSTPSALTIVDSPHGGTQIPPKKVEKLLRRFFKAKHWGPAVQKPSWFRDRLVPYGIPALSAIIVIAVAWRVIGLLQPQGCDKWREIAPITIQKGRHLALVIGASDYQKTDDWPRLKNPTNDAATIMDILTRRYRFTPVEDGSLLMVSGGAAEPDFAAIKNTLARMCADATPNDSLLVYFAGHGQMDRNFGHWIPQDWTSKATSIENEIIFKMARESQARHILIIADCCYAGRIFERSPDRARIIRTQESEPDANLEDLYNKPSRQGMTSGNLETVPDGLENHSPFAACLIRTLKRNQKDFLTARELFRRVRNCAQGKEKKPYFYPLPNACDAQGEFVFRRKMG